MGRSPDHEGLGGLKTMGRLDETTFLFLSPKMLFFLSW